VSSLVVSGGEGPLAGFDPFAEGKEVGAGEGPVERPRVLVVSGLEPAESFGEFVEVAN
jgi:hypothetical protein